MIRPLTHTHTHTHTPHTHTHTHTPHTHTHTHTRLHPVNTHTHTHTHTHTTHTRLHPVKHRHIGQKENHLSPASKYKINSIFYTTLCTCYIWLLNDFQKEQKRKALSCSSDLAVPIHFHSNRPYSRADCYFSEPGLSKPATSSLFNVIKGRNRPVLEKRISQNKSLSAEVLQTKEKKDNEKERTHSAVGHIDPITYSCHFPFIQSS